MEFNELKKKFKSSIKMIAKNNKVANVRVFGSVARGESNDQSDIDFVVKLKKGADLLDLSGFRGSPLKKGAY